MRRTRQSAIAAALTGFVAAVTAAVAGFVLADIYRPHAAGAVAADLLPPVRRSDRWTDWHSVASAVLVVSATVSLVLAVVLVVRAKDVVERKMLVTGAAIVAVVMGILSVLTRPLVEWDQLALRSVSVGSDVDGYWTAGFGDGIRYVLVESSEISQGEYGAALIAHLAAPVVAALALLLLGVVVGRARGNLDSDEASLST